MHRHFGGVLVINLERRPDRWRKISARLDALGVKYERVVAVDGWKEDVRPATRPQDIGLADRHWNPGSAGLCLSVVKALTLARERQWPSVLILEDDCEFDDHVNERVASWMPHVPADWQTLSLGSSHIKPFTADVPNLAGTPAEGHIVRMQGGNAAHAMAVNSSMYGWLIQHMSTLHEPIDSTYRDRVQPQQRSYCFRPHIAWQGTDWSDIMSAWVTYEFLRK